MPNKNVLLVSTDANFFEAPENAFQSRGCGVYATMSGEEALKFAQDREIDLAICRGALDGVDPVEFCDSVGDANNVIIIAGDGDSKERLEAFRKIEGVHVLMAPLVGRALLKLTRKILGVHDRKFISILVQVRVPEPKPTTIFGKSRDLSPGGLLFETSQLIVLHTRVQVSFLIPGADRMVQAQAMVIREVTADDGTRRYGLKFIALEEAERKIIENYVAGIGGQ
jgi:DNA-binding response OmpR family regulator